MSEENPCQKKPEKFILDANVELKTNCIFLGDCLEIMATFPPTSIDLIVVDPPYSRFHHSDVDATLGDFKILEIYFRELAQHCKRILKSSGSIFIFCDYRTYPSIFYGFYSWLKPANLIIWRKDFIGPGIRFRPLHELILYCVMENTKSPKDRHIGDIWKAPRVKSRDHPFQKPSDLFEIMIKNCTNENDVVLDPFCGSGECLIVAKKLKRKWIGIDISPEYAEMARKRVAEYLSIEDFCFMKNPKVEEVSG